MSFLISTFNSLFIIKNIFYGLTTWPNTTVTLLLLSSDGFEFWIAILDSKIVQLTSFRNKRPIERPGSVMPTWFLKNGSILTSVPSVLSLIYILRTLKFKLRRCRSFFSFPMFLNCNSWTVWLNWSYQGLTKSTMNHGKIVA